MLLQCVAGVCYGEHIHDLHPVTLHDKSSAGGWVRISLEEGPSSPIPVKLVSDELDVILERRFENENCKDATATINETKSRVHTVSVGGKLSVGGAVEAEAGVLFSKLKATANANVEVNDSFSNSWTESISMTNATTLAPCTGITYLHTKVKRVAKGSGEVYDHKFVCQNVTTGKQESRYCNQTTLSGEATGYKTELSKWSEYSTTAKCPCLESQRGTPTAVPGGGASGGPSGVPSAGGGPSGVPSAGGGPSGVPSGPGGGAGGVPSAGGGPSGVPSGPGGGAGGGAGGGPSGPGGVSPAESAGGALPGFSFGYPDFPDLGFSSEGTPGGEMTGGEMPGDGEAGDDGTWGGSSLLVEPSP